MANSSSISSCEDKPLPDGKESLKNAPKPKNLDKDTAKFKKREAPRREPIQPHSNQLRQEAESRLNKTQIINNRPNQDAKDGKPALNPGISSSATSFLQKLPQPPVYTDSHNLPGFFCELCQVLSKNLTAHYDHLNSKRRNLYVLT